MPKKKVGRPRKVGRPKGSKNKKKTSKGGFLGSLTAGILAPIILKKILKGRGCRKRAGTLKVGPRY